MPLSLGHREKEGGMNLFRKLLISRGKRMAHRKGLGHVSTKWVQKPPWESLVRPLYPCGFSGCGVMYSKTLDFEYSLG
jgi:hypothetical protein